MKVVSMVNGWCAARYRKFKDDEDGSIVVLSLFLIIAMIFSTGIAVDLMRYETHRARLQAALDNGVLAAAHIDVCLDPSRDPQTVVQDYIDAQGYGALISDIQVYPGESECSVTADANLMINTIFLRLLDLDNIGGVTGSAANHAVGSVEISLVLDISTSMHNGGRIDAMRPAAVDFVNTLYGPTGDHDVVMSLIPYATQVSLGPDLLSQYSVQYPHDYSWCIDFTDGTYGSTALPPTAGYVQSAHFDPYAGSNHNVWVPDPSGTTTTTTTTSDNTGWDTTGGGSSGSWTTVDAIYELNRIWRTPCNPDPNSFVLPYQTDPQPLIDRIEALWPYGDTSINHGARWGAALLDPSSQPVVTGLISAGLVSGDAAGMPLAYEGQGMKVMVLMSDGINTQDYVMPTTHRDQLSNVWLGRMTPSGPTTDHFTPGYYDPYEADHGFRQGTAAPESNSYYFVQTEEPGDADGDGIPNEQYYVVLMEYMADLDPADALLPTDVWVNDIGVAEQQTWQDIWARWPVRTYVTSFLRDPYHATPWDGDWWDFIALVERNEHEEKNAQLLETCNAARDAGILVFTIGFEISDAGADVLSNCATTPAYFYRAETTTIQDTFDSIAASIRSLRLTR